MSKKRLLFPQTYQPLIYLLCSQLSLHVLAFFTRICLIVMMNIPWALKRSVNTPNTQVDKQEVLCSSWTTRHSVPTFLLFDKVSAAVHTCCVAPSTQIRNSTPFYLHFFIFSFYFKFKKIFTLCKDITRAGLDHSVSSYWPASCNISHWCTENTFVTTRERSLLPPSSHCFTGSGLWSVFALKLCFTEKNSSNHPSQLINQPQTQREF